MLSPLITLNFETAVLDPRITFTRAGATATRVNNSGFVEVVAADVPRFDFDPVTLSCRGLLVEESRSNNLLRSEDFTTTWTVSGGSSVAANQLVSPDGTQDADQVTFIGGGQVYQFGSFGTGSRTFSVYVKKNNNRYFSIQLESNTTAYQCVADLDTGTITGTNANTSAVIFNAGGGWYRVAVTNTASATIAYATMQASGGPTFSGGSGIFGIWGAQLEAGVSATSYIPTTTTAITRNADIATITGTNFSDWWQASKGGVLVRARPGTVSGTRPWIQFDDGTANEIIALRGNTTNPELYIVDGGAPQAQIDAGTITANTDYSLTGWWATNDCKARLDSGAVVADTTATIPTVTQARIGSDGTNYLNGHLASISYYNIFSDQIYTRRKNKAVFNLM